MSDDPERRARDRVGVLLGLRVGGAVLLALGLYLWLGGEIAGGYGFGGVLVVVGAVAVFVLPMILIRRWRTPR